MAGRYDPVSDGDHLGRRGQAAALVCVLMLALVTGCADGDPGGSPTTTRPAGTSTQPTADGSGRIVVLGEETMLADILALDLVPVASTARSPEDGFQGIDHDQLDDIEVLDPTDLTRQLDRLAPDIIVASEEAARSLSPPDGSEPWRLIVVPAGIAADEQLVVLGEELGRGGHAALLIGHYDEVRAEALEVVPDGCRVSIASVSPGPTVHLWVTSDSPLPAVVEDLGCDLLEEPEEDPRTRRTTTTTTDPANPVPTALEELLARADGQGRIELHLDDEELDLVSGALLLILQPGTGADAVGDDDHLWDQVEDLTEEIDGWDDVAAVENDRVVLLDPDAFPGLAGQIRLVELLIGLIDEPDLFESR